MVSASPPAAGSVVTFGLLKRWKHVGLSIAMVPLFWIVYFRDASRNWKKWMGLQTWKQRKLFAAIRPSAPSPHRRTSRQQSPISWMLGGGAMIHAVLHGYSFMLIWGKETVATFLTCFAMHQHKNTSAKDFLYVLRVWYCQKLCRTGSTLSRRWSMQSV